MPHREGYDRWREVNAGAQNICSCYRHHDAPGAGILKGRIQRIRVPPHRICSGALAATPDSMLVSHSRPGKDTISYEARGAIFEKGRNAVIYRGRGYHRGSRGQASEDKAIVQVLIVEDDQFYAQRIAELLQDQGVLSEAVQSAEQALAVDLTSFDAAIIDLMLPNDAQTSGITAEESRGGFLTGIAVARRFLLKKPDFRIAMLSSDFRNAEAEAWSLKKSIPFVSKHDGYHSLFQALKQLHVVPGDRAPLSFIVHGHDSAATLELKNYVQNTLKWQEPIVLREQPSSGRTLIEKFEEYARVVDCVFVLLTPDDKVIASGTSDEKRRSRQNVIFELGFFYGALERRSGRIFLLHKGPVELPSDISGIVWIDISNGIAAAGEEIRREAAELFR